MKIARVTIADAAELLAIYGYYVQNTAIAFDYDVPSVEEFQEKIVNITAKYPFLKAVENGEILGYAYANTFKDRKAYDWSVETTIYVKHGKQGLGIGKALYRALENSLQRMGILNLNACIAVPGQEDAYLTFASYKFHQKMGFTLVGRFHKIGYKFNNWYDIVWMQKIIGEHREFPPAVKFGLWTVESV